MVTSISLDPFPGEYGRPSVSNLKAFWAHAFVTRPGHAQQQISHCARSPAIPQGWFHIDGHRVPPQDIPLAYFVGFPRAERSVFKPLGQGEVSQVESSRSHEDFEGGLVRRRGSVEHDCFSQSVVQRSAGGLGEHVVQETGSCAEEEFAGLDRCLIVLVFRYHILPLVLLGPGVQLTVEVQTIFPPGCV